ncbi:MAG: hypothetical protein JSU00_18100 [Acidobacteria bacterium]|nr:hypothetical protein [Acidobacteriota bacterium]
MNPDIHLVIRLQDLDGRIGGLEKEIAALPKHIAQIEKALDVHQRRLEGDRAALAANQKDRKKFEGDIQTHEQKISKLRDQTLQAKTNEQYRAFQNEIQYCQQEIRKCEDRILDLMSASEPLDAAVKKAEAALKDEKVQVDGEKKQAEERSATDRKSLAEAAAARAEAAAQVPPALLKLYERVRKKWPGQPVAEVQEGQCTRCFIKLRPQHFQDLRRGDEVLTCESCGRILFYNPPVDVEKTLSAPRAGLSGGTRVDMT